MLWKQTQIQLNINLYVPFKNMWDPKDPDSDLYYVNYTAPTGRCWTTLFYIAIYIHPKYPYDIIIGWDKDFQAHSQQLSGGLSSVQPTHHGSSWRGRTRSGKGMRMISSVHRISWDNQLCVRITAAYFLPFQDPATNKNHRCQEMRYRKPGQDSHRYTYFFSNTCILMVWFTNNCV